MARILVVYHSQSVTRNGWPRQLRRVQRDGAGGRGVETAAAVTAHDLVNCHGLVICSPEYFGFMAGALKDLFDRPTRH